jgi:hypothetical protein
MYLLSVFHVCTFLSYECQKLATFHEEEGLLARASGRKRNLKQKKTPKKTNKTPN